MATLARGERLSFLDQMRALAIIPVMICHSHSSWLPGGGVGVGIFFALSGFLISKILLDAEDFGPRAAARFVFRRFMRIYPAYLVAMFSALMLALKFDQERAQTIWQAMPDLLLMVDVPSHWAGYATGVIWTLLVEFSFYATVPIAMLLFGRREGLLILCIYLLTHAVLDPFVTMRGIGNMGRFGAGGALALGGILALIPQHLPTRHTKAVLLACLLGIAVLFWLPPSTHLIWRAEILAASLLSCGLIACFLADPNVKILRGAEAIGLISYSLYLWHGLILDYRGMFYAQTTVGFVFVTMIIGAASYLLIERPGIRAGSLISKRIFTMPRRPRRASKAPI